MGQFSCQLNNREPPPCEAVKFNNLFCCVELCFGSQPLEGNQENMALLYIYKGLKKKKEKKGVLGRLKTKGCVEGALW